MVQKSDVFAETARRYLAEIGACDFTSHQARLGVTCKDRQVVVPFFNKQYAVSSKGIFPASGDGTGDALGFSATVAICKYLLIGRHLADIPEDAAWAAYKDFKDAAPLLGYFRREVESAIATGFSGRVSALAAAARGLGGVPLTGDLPYDLHLRLDALPRVPLFLLFNDRDGEFPAECRVLFERRVERYLDMESLAIVGALAAAYLNQSSFNDKYDRPV